MAHSFTPLTSSSLRILLVGKFSENAAVYTYASSFLTTLRALGHCVVALNSKKNYLPWPVNSHDELPGRLKHLNNLIINHALRRAARRLKPDVIFIVKGENIRAATIASLKKQKQLLVNFYPDNPFTLWNGNSTRDVLLTLPYYNQFLIWSQQLMPLLRAAGCAQPVYFPFAYDEALFGESITLSPEDQKYYASDVIFAGSWDPDRERFLGQIAASLPGVKLAIWGNRWQEQLSQSSPLQACLRGPAIYGEKMIKAFRASTIVLNFIRAQNLDAHNMRTFEVPASKAFLLTQHTQEQVAAPFKEGVSIATFRDGEDLVKKIAFYLNNDRIRNEVAHQNWTIAKQFTLTRQLEMFLGQLKEKVEQC